MKFRISATTLEAYRFYLTDEKEYMSFERLKAQLLGLQETTPAMTRGTSLHELLELSYHDRLRHAWQENGQWYYRHLGHYWLKKEVDEIDYQNEGLNEIKTEYIFYDGEDEITLVAKADKVLAYEVLDYKTTRQFEADKYLNSVQWKIYVLAFGSQRFTYRVFEIAEANSKRFHHEIKEEHVLTCYPYPNIKEEVERLALNFIEFLKQHDLLARFVKE